MSINLNDLYKEAILVGHNTVKDFNYELDELEEDEVIVMYEDIVDYRGIVVGIKRIEACDCCGEEIISQMFTNGDIEVECIAENLGYR